MAVLWIVDNVAGSGKLHPKPNITVFTNGNGGGGIKIHVIVNKSAFPNNNLILSFAKADATGNNGILRVLVN